MSDLEIQGGIPVNTLDTAVESVAARPTRRSWPRRAGRGLSFVVMAAAGVVVLGLCAISVGPRFLPYQALVVRSGSMAPTIPTGSVVFYHRVAAENIKVGDVIAFSRPGEPSERVTHRVFKIGVGASGRYFVTKGDANAIPDDWRVPAVGKGWVASFHVPYAGYALADLQSTTARLLLLVIPALLLGMITLYEIVRDRRRGKQA
jgi:signal peptidase